MNGRQLSWGGLWWRGCLCLAVPGIVILAYYDIWFAAVFAALAGAWHIKRWPRLRACLLIPLGIVASYCAIVLANLPIDYVRVTNIGKDICAMARRGVLAEVTSETPPPGLAIGSYGACIFRQLQGHLQSRCNYNVTFDSSGSPVKFGGYMLDLYPSTLSLHLFRHPIWSPIINMTVDGYESAFDFGISYAVYSDEFNSDVCQKNYRDRR